MFDTPVELLENAVYPADIAAKAHNAEVAPSTVGYDQVRRFLNISSAEYDAGVSSPGDPINEFHDILTKTWNDHSVALSMYRDQAPLFFMMTYEGTDAVNHLFAPYHPPYRDGVSQESYRKYWPAVANYYAEVDRLIGEWMKVLPEDTTVIIVSAHGFHWGKTRPIEPPAGRAALSDHRNPGIFIAYGNHVAPSRASHSISIYDIVPTVLAILGLPQSGEMPGQVAQWAFKDISPVQSVSVVSYSEFFGERPVPTPVRVDPKEYQRDLQAIGHILDPSKGMQPQFEDTNAQDAQTANAKPLPPEQWGRVRVLQQPGHRAAEAGEVQGSDRRVPEGDRSQSESTGAVSEHGHGAVRPSAVHGGRRSVPRSDQARSAERRSVVRRLRGALSPAQHDVARDQSAAEGEGDLTRSRT